MTQLFQPFTSPLTLSRSLFLFLSLPPLYYHSCHCYATCTTHYVRITTAIVTTTTATILPLRTATTTTTAATTTANKYKHTTTTSNSNDNENNSSCGGGWLVDGDTIWFRPAPVLSAACPRIWDIGSHAARRPRRFAAAGCSWTRPVFLIIGSTTI